MNKKESEYSIPHHGLSEDEKARADEKLRKLRFESLSKMREEQKMYSALLSLKYEITDYIDNATFSENFLFSDFLKAYVSILQISRRKLAKDLGIHETKFSRLINNRENPGIGLLYRIEEHSNKILPASLLWQIVNMKLVHDIKINSTDRKKESRKVRNKLKFKIS